MGLSLRIFIINDDGTFSRLAVSRYERLLRNDPEERLKQFAGKRIQYALVILETENRKPSKIIRIQYSYLFFDSEGFIDTEEREKEIRLGINMVPTYEEDQEARNVITAHHKFAKKRHSDRYGWAPSKELEEAIIDAVFSA